MCSVLSGSADGGATVLLRRSGLTCSGTGWPRGAAAVGELRRGQGGWGGEPPCGLRIGRKPSG